jgi:outer membrane protein assembly factor BamA
LVRPFLTYIKTEFDTRYYIKVGQNSQWANRIIASVGIPYGNSTILPFVKQSFAGGSNSLRGFRSRSVGPGTSNSGQRDPTSTDTTGLLPDITGDIKLEFNTEYRAKLFSIVNGAVFLDAGNVWLYNDYPSAPDPLNQPGAQFTKDFMKQLAIDAGVGLRIDVTILLLRLDVAIPLRKPWLPEGQRNVYNQITFGMTKVLSGESKILFITSPLGCLFKVIIQFLGNFINHWNFFLMCMIFNNSIRQQTVRNNN